MWHLFIDTGGTFTDAIGIAPSGRLHRRKVLSSSVLRGRVTDGSGQTWMVAQRWHACENLMLGWDVVATADGARLGAVAAWRADKAELTLDRPGPPPVGSLIDIRCPDEAPILAARILTGTRGDQPLPPINLRLATTRGTNALLTRQFPRPTLFITAGLEDLLDIGTQQRPDACLFSLDIRRPAAAHGAVVGVPARVSADGRVIAPLEAARLRREVDRVCGRARGAAAIALLHADLHPGHEQQVAEIVRSLGFDPVVCSHEVSPLVKLLPRAITTVVEAALAPVVSAYVQRIESALGPGSRLDVMTSAGGLVPSRRFAAKDSLLSGPAGGVVAAGAAAASAGEREIFAFDMGGTSTDVSRWTSAAGIEHAAEHTAGDITLISPAVRVHTVAAGGGSVCDFDGVALTVGPGSAGALPGPACYGRGGPLTLTDVQALCGRIHAPSFGVPIDMQAAARAANDLLARLRVIDPSADRASMLDGLLAIAAERIAAAIGVVSSSRGHDPTQAALLAFGGAAGQIACLVAERLGMPRIIMPRDAGLLSARGLMSAGFQAIVQRQVTAPLHEAMPRITGIVAEMHDDARRRLADYSGTASPAAVAMASRLDIALRWRGQETPVEIEADDLGEASIRASFDAAYQKQYGYAAQREPEALELVWLRLVAGMGSGSPPIDDPALGDDPSASPAHARQLLRTRGRDVEVPVVMRGAAAPGTRIDGPALVVEAHGTTVVEDGWTLTVLGDGAMLMQQRRDAGPGDRRRAPALAAAEVELYTSRLESAARGMGAALQRTSVSVNVKERLDFSCAVLDADANLVACAPHVPVHLGSLGVCVREVRRRLTIGPGDVVVTNHPACGGSHLPDVTVIAAALSPRDPATPIAYVAARAHHAEIGGVRPGSMPPDARYLADEGVVIAPMYAIRAGASNLDAVRRLLTDAARHVPSRDVETNLEDLRAAIAACRSGVAELESLAADPASAGQLARMMEAIQQRSARAAAAAIARLRPGRLDLTDRLDDGTLLRVVVEIGPRGLGFDFTGTGGVHAGNLNATPAIVRSCLVYLVRVLAGRDLPLNEGLMRPVSVVLPACLLNPPFDADADPRDQPAVVGGNVEVSQRLVNMLLRGLNLSAESQGTMNNLIFGDERRSYYETIGGGAGAGPGFDGASAVHTHMTNTRITDPEILERRYPVRLERFAIRRGSGGRGQYRGGDGIERVIRFLEPMRVSVLTQRRVAGPPGAAGGIAGLAGAQRVVRSDGTVIPLGPVAGVEVGIGDAIEMLTPGGGGWGTPPDPA